jgi:thiamine-phosphate pyrophosphorylase
MTKINLRGLYGITPDWPDTQRLLDVTEALLSAGCRIVQYRHKTASESLRREQSLALRHLTQRYAASLIINDDVELALFSAADGVHLGEDDGQLAAARAKLDAAGTGKLLGVSCYQSLPLALAAARIGVDYLAFGSFFASPTKPLAKRADPHLLAAAKQATGLPICAIGGITVDNASGLMAAGADMLAVISALFESPDPHQTALKFQSLFHSPIPIPHKETA